jgi:hypothetical protein
MFMQLLQSFDKFDPKDKNSKIMIKSDNIKLMSDVIKKGSPIPYDNTKTYHTLRDYQEAVEIEVFEGENLFVKDNNLLGKFRINNLPKKKAQEVEFDVNFKIDTNGILTVTAQLKENKENKEQLVVESYKGGVSKNEFNLIQKIEQSDPKDNIFNKMRELRIEMDKYYDQIINPKKYEDEDEDEDDDEENKFSIICNYSRSIEEFISLFQNKELNNEAILEKIFEYLEKLFKSYAMALEIKSQANKDFQNDLVKKITDLFTKFSMKIFWLSNLLDILKETPIKFFFDVAFFLMQLFLIKGQVYQLEAQKDNFNKLYSKHYFKAALDIGERYKFDKEKSKLDRDKQKSYEDIKNKCIAAINNLNSEYLLEVQNSLSLNKLVPNDYINQKEKLYLLLDTFHQNISRLEGIDDKESLKSIALCYANVVKIEFKLLKITKNIKVLKDYCNKCIEITKTLGINKNKSWYNEFLEIHKEINGKIKTNELENAEEKKKIKDKMRDTLNDISKKAAEMKQFEFIKYIIDNYPPI